MVKLLKWITEHSKWVLNNRGGGKEEKITEVKPSAPPPQPTAGETAMGQFQAFQAIQPQLEQMFPQQTGLQKAFLDQLQQALTSPQYMTPEEQTAQEAIRQRQSTGARFSARMILTK